MIYLDCGHGMSNRRPGVWDPGARGSGTTEAEVVRGVVAGALSQLHAAGTACDRAPDGNITDVRCPWQRRTLRDGDLFVSVHMNAGGGTGTEVLYPADRPDFATMAAALSAAVAKGLGLKDRGAKPDTDSHVGYVAVLHASDVGTRLLVELGFLDDAEDARTVIAFGGQVLADALGRISR